MAATFHEDDRLVPVRTGLGQADAMLLRSLLEGNNIKVFMNGEHMGSLNFAVRADIMVRASEWKQAEEVLAKVALMPRCAIPIRTDDDGEERACAHCGSTRVHPFVGEVPTIIPGIRLAANREDEWFHCLQCDSHYRDKISRFSGLPIALMWGGAMGAFFLGLYWVIDWIKWL